MRKGQVSSTEAEFNVLLDEIVALIGYTPDKDVFRAFYSTGLAKRLLLNKSASDDMERNMIVKLQKGRSCCCAALTSAEMGDEFTSGDVMLKDLQLSETWVSSWQHTLILAGLSRRTSRLAQRTRLGSKTTPTSLPMSSRSQPGHRMCCTP